MWASENNRQAAAKLAEQVFEHDIDVYNTFPHFFEKKGLDENGLQKKYPICDDLRKYQLTEDIIYCANQIFLEKMNIANRNGSQKTQLLFFCTYCAYKEKGIFKDFQELAQIFNLSPKKARKSITLYDNFNTGYIAPVNIYSPLDLIVDYCKKLNLDNSLASQTLLFAKDLLENSCKELRQENYATVAAGILSYYLQQIGCSKGKDICAISNLSQATINLMRERIIFLDNQ
jgi:transcription initiation factor TFIIIB Brf1 subunit/transcription initiation factor TFIIB